MSEMTKRAKIYGLPNRTTQEELECSWRKVLNFGDRVLLAGYFYNGLNKPSYFGAVYEYLTEDRTIEGAIGLSVASGVEFEDARNRLGDEPDEIKTEHTGNEAARLCVSYPYITDSRRS